MKKFVLAFTVISASVLGVQAQSSKQPFTFGAGINADLPTGDFGKGYTFGIGATLQGEYSFSDQFSGVASAGYTNFFGKTETITFTELGTTYTQSVKNPNIGLIPILVGARFYPAEKFFVGAQIGYGVFTNTGSSSNNGGFDYYPQVGYNGEMIQLILGYNGVSLNGGSLGHIGLTGIYKFGGK